MQESEESAQNLNSQSNHRKSLEVEIEFNTKQNFSEIGTNTGGIKKETMYLQSNHITGAS